MDTILYHARHGEVKDFNVGGQVFAVRKLETTKSAKVLGSKSFTKPDFWVQDADQFKATYYVPSPTTVEELTVLMHHDKDLAKHLINTAYNLYYHNIVGATLTPLTNSVKQGVIMTMLGDVFAGTIRHDGWEQFAANVKATGYAVPKMASLFDEYYANEVWRPTMDAIMQKL
jgi:hypothetical protein